MNEYQGKSTSNISAAARLCLALLLVIPLALVMPLASPDEALAAGSGDVAAWGDNDEGQCDVPAPNSGFTAVSAGDGHSLGLKYDGTVVAWGLNNVGQCDVPTPNSGFTAVSTQYRHSLALRSNGTVAAWGWNEDGQANVPIPNAGFTAVSAGCRHSLALKSDGTVVAWGSNVFGQCDVPTPNSDFVAVAAGYHHNLALKSDGTVVAWGNNSFDALDVPTPNSDFVAVAAGFFQNLCLKSDGTLVTWGNNDDGQCDVPTPNSGFTVVAAGGSHSMGLKSDGTVVAWGRNNEGQCDVPTPNSGFIAVAAGNAHSLAVRTIDYGRAWGSNSDGQCNVPAPNSSFIAVAAGGAHNLGLKADGTVAAWGWNDYGQCDVPTPNSGFIAVAAGFGHSLGLKSDGTIVAWGRNNDGQCDVPDPNSGFIAVAAGVGHSLGLKSDGTVVAWGRNNDGQCDVPDPNSGFKVLSAGYRHSLGLKSDGTVIGWGYNSYGECDVPDPNSGFTAVAAGAYFSLGLRHGGAVAAWGDNYYGQCDVPAPNSGFKAVVVGFEHCLGLRHGGAVAAWGLNDDGQCNVPATNSGFTAVAAGIYHSLGMRGAFEKPLVTSIDPDHALQGQTLDDVTINGSDFRDVAMTIRLVGGVGTIEGTDITWVSDSQVTCDFAIPTDAVAASDWDVYYRHDDDYKEYTLAGGFSVAQPTVYATVSGGNGQVDPASQSVSYGSTAVIDITPDPGYEIASITDNGAPAAIADPYMITGVTVDHNVEVAFEAQTFSVDATILGGNGNLSPVHQTVGWDGTASIAITPDPGYHIASLTDNGISLSIFTNPYVIENVREDHDVVVTFALDVFTVNASVPGGNGTVDPAVQFQRYHSTASVAIYPDPGYHIESITDNGVPVAIANPYVIQHVYEDHDVVVTFALDTFDVNAAVYGGHGTVDPVAQTVDWDGSASIDITPDPGYHIASITDNWVPQTISDPYVIENVQSDHAVVVTFALDTFDVNAAVLGGHGSVDPATQSIEYGGTAVIDIAPDPGYHIASITDNGAPMPISNPYIISNVQEYHDVMVIFATDTFDVAAAVLGGHGSVDPAAQTVDWNGTASIDITPDPGYHIEGIFDNLVPQPVSNPYVVENVQENHAVIVTFAAGTFTVDASVAGGNGSVDPASQAVDWGGTASVHIYPDPGYHIASITDNGVPVPISNPYTIDNVQADHAVEVTFGADVSTWYLAEGATAGGMETWILVANPNPDAVTINVSFLTDDGLFAPTALQGFELGGESRVSFAAGAYMETYDLSTLVSSVGGEVVCERACYGNSRTWAHDSIGVAAPSDTWYLAEGCTEGGMETFVIVLNPGSSETSLDISFQTNTGEVAPTDLQDVNIPAFTRRTFKANDYVTAWDVSTKVEADGPVIAERAMYGDSRTWAHDSVGVTTPSDTWYLAEGCTDGGMETWILVQNPNASEVTVDLTFMTAAGVQEGPQDFIIPAGSRVSFNACSCVTDYNVSTKVTSEGGGIICERAMYGDSRTWAHDSVGVTTPSDTWYLAEGCTDGGMETWILVQNPNASEVTVDLTFMTAAGVQEGPQDFIIPAGSRVSFNACSCVTDYNVSTKVTSEGGGIICERAMYGGGRTWAHDSIGYAP